MLERLRGLPRFDSLRVFVESLLRDKGDRVLSVVLFGSMAKGNYTKFSDYDVLVVVSGEELSFKDRLYWYSLYSDGWVEVFPYTKDEVEVMFGDFNPLVLDALKDGFVIFDRGFWSRLKSRYRKLLGRGVITPKENGWIIRVSRVG